MMQDGYEAYYNEPSVVGHYKTLGNCVIVDLALQWKSMEHSRWQGLCNI